MNKKLELVSSYILKEKEFYKLYFEIYNITSAIKLQKRELELLTILCAKEMNFRLMKHASHNIKSGKVELAGEMGISKNQISNLLRPLIAQQILLVNEEEELEFNSSINNLRSTIKENIKKEDFSFNYNLSFKIEQQ
tara:strand:- start:336 stop:746 length:411 start_codon:yes stop_codon:yes gene_type:complete